MVVEVVQVTDIRLEVVQNFSQLYPCFLAVDSFDRVGQLAQLATAVEVHIRCISIDPVAHAAAFVRRVYGPAEQAALGILEASPAPLNAHRLASAAADFAAKEAFLKAAGTGLREPFSLREIEAVRQENGAPAYRFSGQTAAWVAQHRLRARLSLSHEGGMALAFCTLEQPET